MPEPLAEDQAALPVEVEWVALRAGAMRVDPSQTSAGLHHVLNLFADEASTGSPSRSTGHRHHGPRRGTHAGGACYQLTPISRGKSVQVSSKAGADSRASVLLDRGMVTCRWTSFSLSDHLRAAPIGIAALSSATSALLRLTSRAAMFSSRYAIRLVPGIGTMSSP